MDHASRAAGAELVAFLFLTFALTWIAWIAPALWAPRGFDAIFAPGGAIFLLGVFVPGIVAIALTAKHEGRAGVARLLSHIGRWDVGARWYLFAITYMATNRLLAAVVHRVVTGAWPAFGDTPVVLLLGALLISTWTQAGEEIGWRGYALPRMTRSLGLGGASVVIGVIWAVWHLPLFFIADAGTTGQSFPIYLLGVTGLSVIMGWLYWKTGGSLLLVMLMHASVNNSVGLVPGVVPGATNQWSFNGSIVSWASVSISLLVAAILLPRMRGARVD